MDRHQHSSLWKVRVSRQLFSCEVVPKPSLDFVVFCDFVGLLGFLSFEEKRGEMRTGAPLQHPPAQSALALKPFGRACSQDRR